MCLKRFKESRSRWIYPAFPEHGNVFYGAWGIDSTSRKTIRSVKAEWMVFRICIYRCIACDYLFVGMLAIVFYILVCYDINNVVYRIVYNEEDVTWQLQTIF